MARDISGSAGLRRDRQTPLSAVEELTEFIFDALTSRPVIGTSREAARAVADQFYLRIQREVVEASPPEHRLEWTKAQAEEVYGVLRYKLMPVELMDSLRTYIEEKP